MDEIIKEQTIYHTYAWVYPYSVAKLDFCRQLKETYGWRKINFSDSKWRFNDIRIAVDIKKRYPEVKISADMMMDYSLEAHQMNQEAAQEVKVEEIKDNIYCDLQIEGISNEGGDMYPYQKKTVEILMNNGGKLILGDDMGSGKTLQSLAYAMHSHKQKIMIVCPAVVKYNWENEVMKWTNEFAFVVDAKTESADLRNCTAKFVIINYDILGKFIKELMSIDFDLLIGDEIHYAKSVNSKRSKYLRFLARKIPQMVLMSGTPILSRPVELFNILNMIDPTNWGDYYAYTVKYCQGHRDRFGWNVKGASNMDELQQKISKYFLRRTKEEILPQLPPKTFIDYYVELSPEIRDRYDLAFDEFAVYLKDIKKKKGSEIQRIMQAEALVKLGALRQITTEGKLEAVKELIEEITENGDKVVVFSCYNAPLEKLHQILGYKSVLVTGKVDAEERQDLIDNFQRNPDCQVFLGGTKSAGVGITLTAASKVVFIDYSWTPADHHQALDRCHRLGQTSAHVDIYQLYAKNSIDEYMNKLLIKKQKIFDRIIDGKDVSGEENTSVQQDLIKELSKKV